jgi:hypothetical protein
VLVYGDTEWQEAPSSLLHTIASQLETAATSAGWQRHDALVSAWLEAGLLLQGVADDEFAGRGADEISPTQQCAGDLLMDLAHRLIASWDGALYADNGGTGARLARAAALLPQQPLRLKLPEGHAFYALYPEAYAAAARQISLGEPTHVLGLRSIGGGLAAMVAAALQAPSPLTARPVGHPFARRLALGETVRRHIRAHASSRWCVVDEGPGLSGSSFAAAADALAQLGVAPSRMHLFPGHAAEPGSAATPERRAWWRRTPRHVVSLESPAGTEGWLIDAVADLTGPCESLEDISGGAWRRLRYAHEQDWPPVWPQQERRKYLFRSATGTWLLKFAGLGRIGAQKLARAQALAAARFTPPVAGLRHGFLVAPWIAGAGLTRHSLPRGTLVDTVGRYLGFRRRHFAAPADGGAALETLCDMVAANFAEALGARAAAAVERWRPHLRSLSRSCHRMEIDGRLHAWEWLVTPDGSLLKTDALDHARAHDLVGCQDVVWDIAGARVELALNDAEVARLCTVVEHAGGAPVERGLLPVMTLCYLGFQLGRSHLAAASAGDAAEAARLTVALREYSAAFEALAGPGANSPLPRSLVATSPRLEEGP